MTSMLMPLAHGKIVACLEVRTLHLMLLAIV